MAKTLKFNLRFGDVVIRTVEDLRENFFVDDCYDCFQSGLLHKFLLAREYTQYAKKVDALAQKNAAPDAVITEICEIFNIETDKKTIETAAYALKLRSEKKEAYEAYAKGQTNERTVIQKYLYDYMTIVNQLVEHRNDLSKIEALVWELIDTYMPVLLFDWRVLFFNLSNNNAVYPICHMLTYDFFRERYLTKNDHETVPGDREFITNRLIKDIRRAIENQADYPWVKSASIESVGSFESIEPAGKAIIILALSDGATVRSADGGELITAKNAFFNLTDGLLFNQNRESRLLYYAEV